MAFVHPLNTKQICNTALYDEKTSAFNTDMINNVVSPI